MEEHCANCKYKDLPIKSYPCSDCVKIVKMSEWEPIE